MAAHSYAELAEHVGHDVGVVLYGDVNAAVECDTCSEVLLDFDRHPEGAQEEPDWVQPAWGTKQEAEA
jgi:hypothetical protein